jgi:3-oxoacyl-[acyl-carrier-protein] synthase-3
MLEDLYPTSLETVKGNRHNIVQDGKTVLNMQQTWLIELIMKRNNLTNEGLVSSTSGK